MVAVANGIIEGVMTDKEKSHVDMLVHMAFELAEERCEQRGGDLEKLKRLQYEPHTMALVDRVNRLYKPSIWRYLFG